MNCWGHYLLRKEGRFREGSMIAWFLSTYVQFACFSFLFYRASTLGGLRCWNLSLQSGVGIMIGVHFVTDGVRRISAPALAFLSVSLIVDCATALFTELYFFILDGIAIITGCVFFLLFYPWICIPSAPRVLSTPLVPSLPWVTIPVGIGLLLPILLLMLTIVAFLLGLCCVSSIHPFV